MDNGWISVEERLPNDERRVLVSIGGVIATAEWSGFSWSMFAIDEPINIYRDITHWMPLPAPPHTAPRA